jgi:hypothetical protein
LELVAVKPDNRLDIQLVNDGRSDPSMQIAYFNVMQTFQAVQADLNARGADLRMGITLSGFNGPGPAFGNSAMTDNVDGVRLLLDSTTDQYLMKQWLFYTIGPAQFDTNSVTLSCRRWSGRGGSTRNRTITTPWCSPAVSPAPTPSPARRRTACPA